MLLARKIRRKKELFRNSNWETANIAIFWETKYYLGNSFSTNCSVDICWWLKFLIFKNLIYISPGVIRQGTVLKYYFIFTFLIYGPFSANCLCSSIQAPKN